MELFTSFVIAVILCGSWRTVTLSDVPFSAKLTWRPSTASESVCNLKELILLYPTQSVTILLTETNSQIMVPNLKVKLSEDEDLDIDNQKLCYYQDVSTSEEQATRRVALTKEENKVSGYIATGDEMFDIPSQDVPSSGEVKVTRIVRSSSNTLRTCAVKDTQYEADSSGESILLRSKRAAMHYINRTIDNKYMELYLVVDYNMVVKHGSAAAATNYCLQLVNYVNSFYREFGVHIILVGMEVWSTGQKIELVTDALVSIRRFSLYRRQSITTKHDNAQCISGVRFTNNHLGIAYLGGMCRYKDSVGLTSDAISSQVLETAITTTHEMGHNLGLDHDISSCTCPPDSTCIMGAVSYTGVNPTRWSTCSIAVLKNYLETGLSYCLNDVPTTNSTNTLCGNGIIDEGEDCDPGLRAAGHPCCDVTTCKFKSGATCSSGRCCDTSKCQLLPARTLCAEARNECDLPEFCTGTCETCPSDVHKADWSPCDSGNGHCYEGRCGSLSLRCREIFGSTFTRAINFCFQQNTRGSQSYGFCDYTVAANSEMSVSYNYQGCASSNILCGSVHCQDTVNAPVTLAWPYIGRYYSLTGRLSSGVSFQCFHARHNVKLTSYRDPTLAPNGAVCGTDMVCLNSACVSKTTLSTSPCGSCNGHGVCNNKNNCHCDPPYQGINCTETGGYGGSPDSSSVDCGDSEQTSTDTQTAVTNTPSTDDLQTSTLDETASVTQSTDSTSNPNEILTTAETSRPSTESSVLPTVSSQPFFTESVTESNSEQTSTDTQTAVTNTPSTDDLQTSTLEETASVTQSTDSTSNPNEVLTTAETSKPSTTSSVPPTVSRQPFITEQLTKIDTMIFILVGVVGGVILIGLITTFIILMVKGNVCVSKPPSSSARDQEFTGVANASYIASTNALA